MCQATAPRLVYTVNRMFAWLLCDRYCLTDGRVAWRWTNPHHTPAAAAAATQGSVRAVLFSTAPDAVKKQTKNNNVRSGWVGGGGGGGKRAHILWLDFFFFLKYWTFKSRKVRTELGAHTLKRRRRRRKKKTAAYGYGPVDKRSDHIKA